MGNSDSMPIEITTETLHVPGYRVIPGLIDVHLHGVKGFDVSGPGLAQVITELPRFGITAFLPTTYAGPRADIMDALAIMALILAEPPTGTQPLGIHMEGPWLSPTQTGMADPRHFYPLSQEDIAAFQEIAHGQIRMVTFAPEEGTRSTRSPGWLTTKSSRPPGTRMPTMRRSTRPSSSD